MKAKDQIEYMISFLNLIVEWLIASRDFIKLDKFLVSSHEEMSRIHLVTFWMFANL